MPNHNRPKNVDARSKAGEGPAKDCACGEGSLSGSVIHRQSGPCYVMPGWQIHAKLKAAEGMADVLVMADAALTTLGKNESVKILGFTGEELAEKINKALAAWKEAGNG